MKANLVGNVVSAAIVLVLTVVNVGFILPNLFTAKEGYAIGVGVTVLLINIGMISFYFSSKEKVNE